ncbi:carboxylesterase family protein [Vibrio astriarenae]|uniref:Carboxylesterase family protein n=1 Tax=Vibrio astriarenae TaxID=1481923 RepID=A0A7Z2T7M2_9VIBR|nr:carboxylesterase family protein [Vibrio astriarenae]QIA65707.1 carboxylesterase family protein [Vibrio astriarenae]
MTIAHRSLIAITLAAALAGCGKDSEPTVPFPEVPEPLVPAPAEEITVQIGDTAVKAMKESLVITSNTEDDKIGYVEAFKGIKFAEAERFAHSKIVELSDLESEEGLADATEFGFVCPQTKKTELGQSEDCLNLNIWRPVGVADDAELPVYVFIHGGDFEYGAGSNALVQGDTVVAQGASEGSPFIYVSFNYRLGLLGSMWVDDEKGGNFGIGDQKRALQWVNENIAVFGGDPQKVTLIGQGSGASSVSILQMSDSSDNSPVANNYIQRSIMQSTPYGLDYQTYETAQGNTTEICKAFGTTETKTSLNVIKQALNALLALNILPDEVSEKLKPIVDDMPTLSKNTVCADDYVSQLQNIDLDIVLDTQKYEIANPVTKTISWLSENIIGVISKENATPMANFMPFLPYIDSYETCGLFGCTQHKGQHLNSQPVLSGIAVPTIIGNNAKDSNTMSMLPTLTFLIPTILELLQEDIDNGTFEPIDDDNSAINLVIWLQQEDNQQRVVDMVSSLSANEVSAQLELGDVLDLLPSSAYEAVTKLFFGLGNSEMNNELLQLTEYAPKSENELGGATDNMASFKMLMNDMLFQGPARNQAIKAEGNFDAPATLYHFAFKPSFNVWTHNTDGQEGDLDVGDLLKSVACLSGACSGSELPFIFNKPFKLDGTEVSPTKKDQALMNDMSRLWFSNELFTDHNYSAQLDNVLSIDADGEISEELDWDSTHNKTTTPGFGSGRLQGLNESGLMLQYMTDYEIPLQ